MATNRGSIPEREIIRLIEGSYEQRAIRVGKAIEGAVEKLGLSEEIEVAGVFDGYVVAHNADRSRAYKIKYEIAENKDVIAISAEQLPIKAVTPAEYALAEARAFVYAFINGSRSEAGEHLKNILPVVQEWHAHEPARALEAFESLVRGERGWKRVFAEREEQIKSAVGADIGNQLAEKFRKLYDGSIQESEFGNYSDLVTSDLKYLTDRVDALLTSTEKAVSGYKSAAPALKTESTDATIQMFESFAEDFVVDLRGVKNALVEANDIFNRIDEFGKIYDVLASELHRYELAGRFVEKMSRSLFDSATEED